MNASARIETEAEAGSGVHFSLDVNERLVTNFDDTSKRPTAPAGAAPDEQSVPTPRRRPFPTPLPRRQKSPGAGVPDQTVTPFDSNVTSRGGHVETDVHPTPSFPATMEAQSQLESLQLRAAMAEATARLLAAVRRSRPRLSIAERQPNTFSWRTSWRTPSPDAVVHVHGRHPALRQSSPLHQRAPSPQASPTWRA